MPAAPLLELAAIYWSSNPASVVYGDGAGSGIAMVGLVGDIDCGGLDAITGPATPWLGVVGLGEPPAVAAGGSVTVRV